jgi:hypothetical protein
MRWRGWANVASGTLAGLRWPREEQTARRSSYAVKGGTAARCHYSPTLMAATSDSNVPG